MTDEHDPPSGTVAAGLRDTLYRYHQLSASKKREFEKTYGWEPAEVYLTDAELLLISIINGLAQVWPRWERGEGERSILIHEIRLAKRPMPFEVPHNEDTHLPILTDEARDALIQTYKEWSHYKENYHKE